MTEQTENEKQLMVKCSHCEHQFLAHEIDTWGKRHREENEENDLFVFCPECNQMTRWEESYVRDRDELPPFKCKHGSFGLEVLVGYEGTDGGRWAVRDRDSEEELRKMLQQAVDTYDPDNDLDGFEKSIHFVISHAVQIGWFIYVPSEQMDELDAVDAERRRKLTKKNEIYAAQLGMVSCPDCHADDVVLLEKSSITGRRDIEVVDGRIEVGELYGEELDSSMVPNFFHCRVCGHTWVVPDWVADKIEW